MKKINSLLCSLGLHHYGRYMDLTTAGYVMICKRCKKEAK